MGSASGGKWSVKAAREESGSHAEGARGGRDGRRGALARLDSTCSLGRRVRDRRELTVRNRSCAIIPTAVAKKPTGRFRRDPISWKLLAARLTSLVTVEALYLQGPAATRREQIQVKCCCNEPERSDSSALTPAYTLIPCTVCASFLNTSIPGKNQRTHDGRLAPSGQRALLANPPSSNLLSLLW